MDHRLQGKTKRRIRRELKTVRVMIEIYCRGHHKTGRNLCPECAELWEYTQKRVEHCSFRLNKPTCFNCTVHCFKSEMRERIKTIMRYSGPRMPLHHPVLSIYHFIDGNKPAPAKHQSYNKPQPK